MAALRILLAGALVACLGLCCTEVNEPGVRIRDNSVDTRANVGIVSTVIQGMSSGVAAWAPYGYIPTSLEIIWPKAYQGTEALAQGQPLSIAITVAHKADGSVDKTITVTFVTPTPTAP